MVLRAPTESKLRQHVCKILKFLSFKILSASMFWPEGHGFVASERQPKQTPVTRRIKTAGTQQSSEPESRPDAHSISLLHALNQVCQGTCQHLNRKLLDEPSRIKTWDNVYFWLLSVFSDKTTSWLEDRKRCVQCLRCDQNTALLCVKAWLASWLCTGGKQLVECNLCLPLSDWNN